MGTFVSKHSTDQLPDRPRFCMIDDFVHHIFLKYVFHELNEKLVTSAGFLVSKNTKTFET